MILADLVDHQVLLGQQVELDPADQVVLVDQQELGLVGRADPQVLQGLRVLLDLQGLNILGKVIGQLQLFMQLMTV